jgi:hypothetical protein
MTVIFVVTVSNLADFYWARNWFKTQGFEIDKFMNPFPAGFGESFLPSELGCPV